MILVTRTYTRPDTETPWHIDEPFQSQIYTDEFKEHVRNNYRESMISVANLRSENGLELNFRSVWTSLEQFQKYFNDPVCQAAWQRRDAHNEFYRIVSPPSTVSNV
jgi:hypothetical protein